MNYNFYPNLPQTRSLEGAVCLITGVTGGIGEAIARGLAAYGVRMAFIGRDSLALQDLVEQWPGQVSVHPADLDSEAQTRQAAQAALGQYGQADIFIHAAGVMEDGPWNAITYEQMERLYRVNVLSAFTILQEITPELARREGQVVIINSSAVQTIRAGKAPYTMAKTALKAMTDVYRQEHNGLGIRTVSVIPGRTATNMQKRLHAGRGEEFHPETFIQPEDIAGLILHLLHMPRTAEVTDLSIRPMQNWMKPGAAL